MKRLTFILSISKPKLEWSEQNLKGTVFPIDLTFLIHDLIDCSANQWILFSTKAKKLAQKKSKVCFVECYIIITMVQVSKEKNQILVDDVQPKGWKNKGEKVKQDNNLCV